MDRGLFQGSYKVVDSNYNLVVAEQVVVGDKLKSLDTTTLEFVDVEVKRIISSQSLPSIYIETPEPTVGFVLAAGFSFYADMVEQLVSHDPTISLSRFNTVAKLWSSRIPALTHIITEDNIRGVGVLNKYSDPNLDEDFINFELVSGDNVFITPNDQKLEPFSIHI